LVRCHCSYAYAYAYFWLAAAPQLGNTKCRQDQFFLQASFANGMNSKKNTKHLVPQPCSGPYPPETKVEWARGERKRKEKNAVAHAQLRRLRPAPSMRSLCEHSSPVESTLHHSRQQGILHTKPGPQRRRRPHDLVRWCWQSMELHSSQHGTA